MSNENLKIGDKIIFEIIEGDCETCCLDGEFGPCPIDSPCIYTKNEKYNYCLKEITEEFCEWQESDYDNGEPEYKTSCGNHFPYTDGSPKDNAFKYCTYCQRKIKEVNQ